MNSSKIQLAIVDDSPDIRQHLADLFSLLDEVDVLWLASDGEEAVKKIELNMNVPQLILMDIEMRNMNGIKATKKIKAINPHIKILMMTVFDDHSHLQNAIIAGADGYILKGEKPLKLIELIKETVDGALSISSQMKNVALDLIKNANSQANDFTEYQITKREKEIILLLCKGFTSSQISKNLCISPSTVRTHSENIYRKLKVNSKTELIHLCYKNQWLK